MAENIEFIAAKDLPVAEGDEVSVLCLEDGEMKQKPGASLGGEKPDLVLKLTAPIWYGGVSSENTSVSIKSGSLDAVVASLEAGKSPVVMVEHYDNSHDTSVMRFIEGGVHRCSVLHYADRVYFTCRVGLNQVRIIMDINDPDYLEVWMYPIQATTIQVI